MKTVTAETIERELMSEISKTVHKVLPKFIAEDFMHDDSEAVTKEKNGPFVGLMDELMDRPIQKAEYLDDIEEAFTHSMFNAPMD